MIAEPTRPPRGVVKPLLAALFFRHARAGVSVAMDVDCDFVDGRGGASRSMDLVLVDDRSDTLIFAVEVRGTQSKKYVADGWPCMWIVHTERTEIEVVRPDSGSVIYRETMAVPLPPELDRHGLGALPVTACFDAREAFGHNDGWVQAQRVLTVLAARGLHATADVLARVLTAPDAATLVRWLTLAATAQSIEAFVTALR